MAAKLKEEFVVKKFVAVLLPIILIGSLVSAFSVAAAVPACIDDSARPPGWSHAPDTPLDRSIHEHDVGTQGCTATVISWVRVRATPAGRAEPGDLGNVLHHGLAPGTLLQVTGQIVDSWSTCDRMHEHWVQVYWPPNQYVTVGYIFFRFVDVVCP